jgi:hypothetical protein
MWSAIENNIVSEQNCLLRLQQIIAVPPQRKLIVQYTLFSSWDAVQKICAILKFNLAFRDQKNPHPCYA